MILDGNVTGSDIADSAITGADVAANTLTAADIAANAIGASEIATGAVGSAEIATGAVTGVDVASNTLTAADIATNAIGESELDMFSLFEPPGIVGSGSDTVNSPVGEAQTIAARTVAAPTAGRILAIATANYVFCGSLNSTNTRCDLYHTLSTSSTANANSGTYQRCALLEYGGSALQTYNYRTCTVMGVFPVGAGSRTIYWRAGVQDNLNDTVTILDGDLLTVFLPD
jgi:hypothetical protein